MARTTGPLFSFDASGTIAGAVVFSKWRGRNYVRRHAIPMNPRAPKQLSVRAMLGFLSHYWQTIAVEDQATWLKPAAAKNYSEFNAYIHANMISWKHFEWPTQTFPRNPTSTPAGQPTIADDVGVGMVTVTITPGSPAPDWGYALHLELSPSIAPSRANLMAIIAFDASPLTIAVSPLLPGAWHAVAIPFNVDGIAGTPSAQLGLTVTS